MGQNSHFFILNFILLTLAITITPNDAILSEETEKAVRDFANLRYLEKRLLETMAENNASETEAEMMKASASMDEMGIFRPSYRGPQQSGGPRGMGGLRPSGGYSSEGLNNLDEEGGNDSSSLDPGMGGFFQHSPQGYNNHHHRPLIGGPGEEDFTSVGMGVGPSGYSSSSNQDSRKQSEISHNPEGHGHGLGHGGHGDDEDDDEGQHHHHPGGRGRPPPPDFFPDHEGVGGGDGGIPEGLGNLEALFGGGRGPLSHPHHGPTSGGDDGGSGEDGGGGTEGYFTGGNRERPPHQDNQDDGDEGGFHGGHGHGHAQHGPRPGHGNPHQNNFFDYGDY